MEELDALICALGIISILLTISTISLCTSYVCISESPIWKSGVWSLFLLSLSKLSLTDWLGIYLICVIPHGVKSIGLPVIGSYLVNIKAREKSNVQSLDIYLTFFKFRQTWKSQIEYTILRDIFLSEILCVCVLTATSPFRVSDSWGGRSPTLDMDRSVPRLCCYPYNFKSSPTDTHVTTISGSL